MLKKEFTDGIVFEEILKQQKILHENQKYNEFQIQANIDPISSWGEEFDVLLISDRASGRAMGLNEYLKKKTNLKNVVLKDTLEDIENYFNQTIPNILIFVGMPENMLNYQAIKKAKMLNPYVLAVIFAFLDKIIERECLLNHIVI